MSTATSREGQNSMNRSKRLALAAVVGLSTGLSVVDLPAVRGVDPETPRERRPDIGPETKPPVAPLRNPDWDGPRPPKSQPFPLRRGGGPPGPQFEREAIRERAERPRRPGTPFDREMAELEERRRDLPWREFERRKRAELERPEQERRERAERERDEREMIERERLGREHHEREHHGRMLELRMQELEL